MKNNPLLNFLRQKSNKKLLERRSGKASLASSAKALIAASILSKEARKVSASYGFVHIIGTYFVPLHLSISISIKQKEKKAKKEKKKEKRAKKERKAFEVGEGGEPIKSKRRDRKEKKKEKLRNAALAGDGLVSGNTMMEGKKVLLLKKPDSGPKPAVASSSSVNEGPVIGDRVNILFLNLLL